MDSSRSWSFVSDALADARTVRLAVRRFLETSADDMSDIDGAELIVGELIANVVRHGSPPFGVCVDWNGDVPTLYVSDRGRPRKRLLYSAPDDLAENGRGLLLVRALSHGSLAVEARGGTRSGTRVVVTLPVRRRNDRAA
jgi:anti-sigma regulatory factor (Ser/Thr protein kinase)